MTITFGPKIQGIKRGELQQWLEESVDRDNDLYTMLVSQKSGNYVYLRENWHTSPADTKLHLTGDVYFVSSSTHIHLATCSTHTTIPKNGSQLGAAHVYENGTVTIFPAGQD